MKERAILFIATTVVLTQFFILFPTNIWIQNQFNFSVPITEVIGLLFFVFSAVILFSLILILVTPKFLRQYFVALLSILSVVLFIQQNIFVWDYGLLNGNAINFETHSNKKYIDLGLWVTALIGLLFLRKYIIKHCRSMLLFSTAASILVLSVTLVNHDPPTYKSIHSITENNKFTFSPDTNVFLFILDAFQSDLFWQIIDHEPELTDQLTGFKFYPDTASVFAKTYPTIPLLLTGKVYQKKQSLQKFLNTAYDNSWLSDLVSKGWDVGLYPYSKNLIPVKSSIMSNLVNNIDDTEKMTNYFQALDITLFRSAPHMAKEGIYNAGDFLIQTEAINYIEKNNHLPTNKTKPTRLPKTHNHRGINFLENLKRQGNTKSTQPSFRFYHLLMPHSPFELNRNLKPEPKLAGFEAYLDYAYASLILMIQYLKELKKLGIYDRSAIIIAADHGGGEYTKNKYDAAQGKFVTNTMLGKEISSGKPLLLIKDFNDNSPFKFSTKPVSLLDVLPTLSKFSGIESASEGIEVNAIKENQSRLRPYYYFQFTGSNSKYLQDFDVFKVSGHVYNESSWIRSGSLSASDSTIINNGKYELNKTAQFGTDLKIDTDYSNQFLIGTDHVFSHSSVVSKNQKIMLSIPLTQPLNLNKIYLLQLEIPISESANNLTITVNNKKIQTISSGPKNNTYTFPFIPPDENIKILKIKIQNNDSKQMKLSKFKIHQINIAELNHNDDFYIVDFTKNIDPLFPDGFLPENHWGRWTSKNQASLLFRVPKHFCENNSIRLKVKRFYTQVNPDSFQVFMNGVPLIMHVLNDYPNGLEYYAKCSIKTPEPINVIEFKFQTNTTVSPASIKESNDVRKFGVGLKTLEFGQFSTLH